MGQSTGQTEARPRLRTRAIRWINAGDWTVCASMTTLAQPLALHGTVAS